MSRLSVAELDIEPVPGVSVEWRDIGEVRRGVLVEPDEGLGGPWWLVAVDGGDERLLVKTWALYPAGGIRRERMADAIHQVMLEQARRYFGTAGYRPAWSDALACADAVIALEGGA